MVAFFTETLQTKIGHCFPFFERKEFLRWIKLLYVDIRTMPKKKLNKSVYYMRLAFSF